METYQGSLVDQFKKIAARQSKVTSVIKALPLVKRRPPSAGSKARIKGTECQCGESPCSPLWKSSSGRGCRISSVDSLRDFLVSEKLSENIELRRRSSGIVTSPTVAARVSGLCRIPEGGGLVCLPEAGACSNDTFMLFYVLTLT